MLHSETQCRACRLCHTRAFGASKSGEANLVACRPLISTSSSTTSSTADSELDCFELVGSCTKTIMQIRYGWSERPMTFWIFWDGFGTCRQCHALLGAQKVLTIYHALWTAAAVESSKKLSFMSPHSRPRVKSDGLQ